MKKQTAVEWLVAHLTEYGFNLKLHKAEINQAKELEAKKQQKYNEMLQMLEKVAIIRYTGASSKELDAIFIEAEQLIKSATEI
jgi:urease accessory protein UreH